MAKGRKRSSRSMGKKGEEIAVTFLKDRGYKILETNYRTKFGEIDIIAREGQIVAFIEVKLRNSKTFGLPLESIDVKKRYQIEKVARYFLMQRNLSQVICRFDIVSVIPSQEKKFQCELVKDAFRID